MDVDVCGGMQSFTVALGLVSASSSFTCYCGLHHLDGELGVLAIPRREVGVWRCSAATPFHPVQRYFGKAVRSSCDFYLKMHTSPLSAFILPSGACLGHLDDQ